MPAYEIVQVGENPRTWHATQGGEMRAYRLTLRNADGREMQNVEWSRKVTSPAPTVGQKVEGTVDTSGSHGPKFKMAPTSSYSGGGKTRDPAERKAIAMQASQKVAVDAARLAIDAGVLKPTSQQDVSAAVLAFADDFFRQVEQVAR
ncbi:MAG TPA: hypothetical protein VFZ00_20520 [Solirubrobacter sp.]|nr:hypothetical protein [Solirubrobacter sp.]